MLPMFQEPEAALDQKLLRDDTHRQDQEAQKAQSRSCLAKSGLTTGTHSQRHLPKNKVYSSVLSSFLSPGMPQTPQH